MIAALLDRVSDLLALVDDSDLAWALLLLCLSAYGLAPDGVRERWWAAWTGGQR